MPLTRKVNGQEVPLSEAESAETEAEWVANNQRLGARAAEESRLAVKLAEIEQLTGVKGNNSAVSLILALQRSLVKKGALSQDEIDAEL